MKRNTMKITVFTLCVIVAAIGGCATETNTKTKIPAARTRGDKQAAAEENTFAAGAGRTPTAATSYSFAKILIAQGRDRDALYVLSHIIREHPKFLPAYNEMAGVYVRADRLDDAVAAIQTGLEHAPNDGVLHNNLGMCYLLKEQPDQALAAFTRATELVPNSATFRANRASALALTAHDAEAETEYRRVVGSLQARQNVLTLSRARDSRSESQEIQKPIAAPTVATPTTAPAAAPTAAIGIDVDEPVAEILSDEQIAAEEILAPAGEIEQLITEAEGEATTTTIQAPIAAPPAADDADDTISSIPDDLTDDIAAGQPESDEAA